MAENVKDTAEGIGRAVEQEFAAVTAERTERQVADQAGGVFGEGFVGWEKESVVNTRHRRERAGHKIGLDRQIGGHDEVERVAVAGEEGRSPVCQQITLA